MITKVFDIIKNQLGINEISLADSLSELNCDSLDFIEIVMDIEDTFNIEISDQDFTNIDLVGDLVMLVKRITNERE